MTKQELARGRNWQKARLTGQVLNNSYFTPDEKDIIKQINNLKQKLLSTWDDNSKKLGLKVERFDLTIYTVEGEFFIHNISKAEILFWTEDVDKKDYKIKKL